MAIVVVIAGTWFGYSQLADSGCTGSIKLNVAATPEISPAVTNAANKWSQGGGNVNGTCVSVNVESLPSADVASAIAGQHGVNLSGLGQPSGAIQVPDVWLPDSSTWLLRLQNEASGFTPSKVTSVAQSPLVIAMPEPISKQLGLQGKKVAWSSLLGQIKASDGPRFGIVNPARDASGLAALMSIGSAIGAGQGSVPKLVDALTYLAKSRSELRDELLESFPKATDEGTLLESLGAAPLSEEDVIAYNAKRPPVALSALYLEPNSVPMDYPYSVLPQVVDGQKIDAAQALLKQLTASSFKNEISAQGLRAPDGTYGSSFVAPAGAPPASPAISAPAAGSDKGGTAAAGLDATAVSKVVGSWNATTQAGRVLAVFDVSGSMNRPVPTANNASRADVTKAAATTGLSLFSDEWAVGVWRFSTDMGPNHRPWEELIPITSLRSNRKGVQATIPRLTPKEDGDTGLYNTVLDAYNYAKANWKQGKVNSVILFTDGENDNVNGIDQAQLLAQLKKVQDPKRFVRLVLIGIGNDVNKNELGTIQKAVRGSGLYFAPDPTKITDIFLQAIGSRTGVE
ncbi:substrate-binding and VWA domain-containing protein [Actinoplanes oblitus]|uniref:Substrate-binding and VWA domain-containing protein n=1 Tax=Actinoplanes oblitus TaxID=3040509 RepID=A0ABY8WIA2_9ACTN|nr:substrate-binding and VWA domain-containing protein [Actinoplanes oblitus]WIM97540.1 substrate-binding and VWA domain-containing protein [Actinoplanes oblitus]